MTEDQAERPCGARASLLVLPLGELTRAEAEAAIEPHFGAASREWFDRGALRHRLLPALYELRRRRVDAAVLVASDLDQPRLRVTSLLLALARADGHWRVDAQGHCERWSLSTHLARNAAPIARHLLACGLALMLAEPLLYAVEAITRRPRPTARRRARPRVGPPPPAAALEYMHGASHEASHEDRRILYLRAQLWLGLSGGGSVAHTAGVIGGLRQLGVNVMAVASDRLTGVDARTRVVTPEVWFDGSARELEDLAYNVAFLLAAWRAARTFRANAIYQRHTAFNVTGAVLARLLRVPLVVEYNSSEVWKGRYWGGLRLERAAARVERINLGAADRVVVVSRVLRDELINSDVPADRIVITPNGVDPSMFRADLSGDAIRVRHGLESNVVVGFSGTFGAWHGIPTLAAAIPLVLAARPNVRWLVIGDGPLRSTLDTAVRGDDRVIRPGMLPHAEMPAHLAACDILVSPHGRQADGREFFGSPTKLYEYMAAGRPIVASRIGQIAEVLEDEVTALLVPADDPTALAEAIVRLVDDVCLRERLGRGARQSAEQRHTWRQNAARLLEALEGVA